MTKGKAIRVPAAEGKAFEANIGQYIKVINLEGKQVGDFVAFNASDLDEKLSTNHTFVHTQKLLLEVGDEVVTNRRTPMLEILRDDCGVHDLLIPACDPWRYEKYFNLKGHRNCSDNLVEALRPWGIKREQIPQPIKLFQNMGELENRRLDFLESVAKPGDCIVFRALMNIIGAVSACPMDLNRISGEKLTDLEIVITDRL